MSSSTYHTRTTFAKDTILIGNSNNGILILININSNFQNITVPIIYYF